MSIIQSCHDTKDILDLFKPQDLYLKPIARLNVSVQLPQLKKSGAKISNWEVMERVKEMAKPLTFPVFKVAKSSLEFIRFEAEIENYGSMDTALAKLDMKTIKLSGFEELLKIRAAEAKPPFPTRHDWDTYFRENKIMNEMKAGERPDTIHLLNLPNKWFVNPQDRSGASKEKPSDYVLKKVFQIYGEIRAVDIPILDPYREKMKASISGIQTFSFGQDLVFEAYIQYKEYIGFVKAMNSLKGMKLLNKDRSEDRAWVANIKVDFDKTKHLADSTVKKRSHEREKLIDQEREKEEGDRRRQELERMKREEELRKMKADERDSILKKEADREEKMRRRMEREDRRRQRKLQRRNVNDEEEMNHRIAVEERKLLVAQRKLESIRMLDELLERVKVVRSANKNVKSLEKDLLKAAKAATKLDKRADITALIGKDKDEKELRDKLVSKLKQKEIDKMEQYGEKLRDAKDNSFYYSDDSIEDISDEDLDESSDLKKDANLDEISDDDLRLTSTDDENKGENGKQSKDKTLTGGKKRKKEKKEKKRKKRKAEKAEKAEKDDKKEKKKRRKELESHITLAQRIADRDQSDQRSRSRDHERRRSRSPRDWDNRKLSREDEMLERRAQVGERQRQNRMEARKKEQAMEEVYDKMVNPHLYGSGEGGGGYRRLKKGEHYEDVQREALENEIRIRERREKYNREQRYVDVQGGPRRGAGGGGNRVHYNPHFNSDRRRPPNHEQHPRHEKPQRYDHHNRSEERHYNHDRR